MVITKEPKNIHNARRIHGNHQVNAEQLVLDKTADICKQEKPRQSRNSSKTSKGGSAKKRTGHTLTPQMGIGDWSTRWAEQDRRQRQKAEFLEPKNEKFRAKSIDPDQTVTIYLIDEKRKGTICSCRCWVNEQPKGQTKKFGSWTLEFALLCSCVLLSFACFVNGPPSLHPHQALQKASLFVLSCPVFFYLFISFYFLQFSHWIHFVINILIMFVHD